MRFAFDKVCMENPVETWLTERGSTFGYGNLVVDTRAIPIMQNIARPVIIDASHGVQLPGAGGGQSSGQREYIPTIAKAGIAAGADGLLVEMHPTPSEAWCDADQAITPTELKNLMKELTAIANILGRNISK